MSIVQDLNRYKFECGGVVPVGPMQLLDFDNISIILQWSFVWGMFPEVRGGSPLRECIPRRLLEEPERGENSVRKIQVGNRSGCAKSLWAWRNVAAELSSASAGGGFCKLPQPQRACWLLSPLFRLAKGRGTDEGECLWVLSRAKVECCLSFHPTCSWDPRSLWGIAVL